MIKTGILFGKGNNIQMTEKKKETAESGDGFRHHDSGLAHDVRAAHADSRTVY